MDVLKFYQDYHIDHVTEHKNVREGWIGIHCPFCPGKQNYHLGYSMDEKYFSCWRCGKHSEIDVVKVLLDVNFTKAKEIAKMYGGTTDDEVRKFEQRVYKTGKAKLQYPIGKLKFYPAHFQYLEKIRKFDTEKIIKEWGLLGTGLIAYLDGINYSKRIIAPIIWDGKLVSWQSRDITDKHPAKYMACPPEREIMHHKHVLYGKFDGKKRKRGVCVEGITDVWRLGSDAFATFGIKYTPQQVRAIAHSFEEVIIMFDPEPQAQKQAWKLQKQLEGKGIRKVDRHILKTDPGDLSQREADVLMHYLMK